MLTRGPPAAQPNCRPRTLAPWARARASAAAGDACAVRLCVRAGVGMIELAKPGQRGACRQVSVCRRRPSATGLRDQVVEQQVHVGRVAVGVQRDLELWWKAEGCGSCSFSQPRRKRHSRSRSSRDNGERQQTRHLRFSQGGPPSRTGRGAAQTPGCCSCCRQRWGGARWRPPGGRWQWGGGGNPSQW
jgi:hypothetical protein